MKTFRRPETAIIAVLSFLIGAGSVRLLTSRFGKLPPVIDAIIVAAIFIGIFYLVRKIKDKPLT